jgi:hypothetical protein
MKNYIFDCDALTVIPKDNKSVYIHGYDLGQTMTLEEIRDFGLAVFEYFKNERGVDVSCN